MTWKVLPNRHIRNYMTFLTYPIFAEMFISWSNIPAPFFFLFHVLAKGSIFLIRLAMIFGYLQQLYSSFTPGHQLALKILDRKDKEKELYLN